MQRTIRRRNVKKGFQFTIMLAGSSGLGKSTFINTLFESEVISPKSFDDPAATSLPKTMKIIPYNIEIDEDNVRLSLTVIDTPGFGDNISNAHCFSDIVKYIEDQYDDILAEESRIKRNPKFQDNRVHAMLYFIPPTGHCLKELDIEFMKRVGRRVNIIPIIAKGDTLTKEELEAFKVRIREDIETHEIPIFNFPYDPDEDDQETIDENESLRSMIPFSVIGAENDPGSEEQRGRQYPWGFVDVDDPEHCDFTDLRVMLLSSHLQDLKDMTHDLLYENYRTAKLSMVSGLNEEGSVPLSLQQAASNEDIAAHVKLKENQIRRDQEKLREKEAKLKQDMQRKRAELLEKQQALKTLEQRMEPNGSNSGQ